MEIAGWKIAKVVEILREMSHVIRQEDDSRWKQEQIADCLGLLDPQPAEPDPTERRG
jgi:hypothetical protein